MSGIYRIRNRHNLKSYIGSAKDISRRWRHHLTCLNNNKHRNKKLQHAWNKYGRDSFEFLVVEACTAEVRIIREQYYLDTEKPDYNICPTAGCPSHQVPLSEDHKLKISLTKIGRTVSEETRKRLSLSAQGRVISEDDRRKKSLALKGRKKPPRSAEHCANLAKVRVGKRLSLETRAKMSEAQKRRFHEGPR